MLGRTKEKKNSERRRKGVEEMRGLRRDWVGEDPKKKKPKKSKLKIQTC